MRHWLLIFMIVLLPLRAWAGGGMAMQMAIQETRQTEVPATEQSAIAPITIANYSISTGTSGTFDTLSSNKSASQAQPDCHGHMASAMDHTDATGQSAGNPVDCASACGVCQVCHSVALASEWPVSINSAPAYRAVGPSHQMFTSAERALSLKPPIS